MAAGRPQRKRPVEVAIVRLLALAAKGAQPRRMAREVEIIAGEWRGAPDADEGEILARLDELLGQISAGVDDAAEQLSDVDRSEPAALRQAQATLDALIATRDATQREMAQR
jgi:hypothetical protein